ncbi:MAG: 2Fe-2S iron-sulfur cluster-binding protein, partial [Curvibacter sp.]
MSFTVRIEETGQSFEVGPGETVLNAGMRQSVTLPHECTLGGCGTCRVRVLQGKVEYDEFPFGLTEAEAAEGYALVCQARPCSDLQISAPAPAPAHSEPGRHAAEVLELRQVSQDVCILELELPLELAANLVYQPGQHLNVHLGDGKTRSFSMARASAATGVELHIRQIPGGRFTQQQLPQLRAGDTLEIELPLGGFHYHARDERPVLMLATGTGIAPLRSILESLLDSDDCPPISLYWGMREPAELYLHNELESWRDRLYEFNYVPVLSRPGPEWNGRRGYVQQAACEDLADLSGYGIYLCGSPAMIAEAKAALL